MSEQDDWNRCPGCDALVDVDECSDGADYECDNCGLGVVATSFTDGSWRLCTDSGVARLIRDRDYAHETLRVCAELLSAPEINSSNAMAIVMTLRVVIGERHRLITAPGEDAAAHNNGD